MLPPPMKAIADGSCGHRKGCRLHWRRAPNSAVPMRTMVAPSAMASSKSSLMPIDSVSMPGCRAATASNSALSAGSSRRRAGSGCGSGSTSVRAAAGAGSAAMRVGQRRHVVGPAAGLAGLVVDVHLQQHVQRRQRRPGDGGPGRRPAWRGRPTAPSRSARPPRGICSTAGGRSGAIPAPARAAPRSWRGLPGRSSRRRPAGRQRRRSRTALAGCASWTPRAGRAPCGRRRPAWPRFQYVCRTLRAGSVQPFHGAGIAPSGIGLYCPGRTRSPIR